MQVVGEADDGRAAIEVVEETSPDVPVLDLGRPELNGIEVVARLRDAEPPVGIFEELAERPLGPDDPYHVLTPRQREVLQLIAEGHGTRKIAERLYISVKTVETHRADIMKRLDIHSVAGLTKYAMSNRITPSE